MGLEPKIGTVTATPVGMVVLAEVTDEMMLVTEVVGIEILGLVIRVVAEVLDDGVPVDPVFSVTGVKPGNIPSPMYS